MKSRHHRRANGNGGSNASEGLLAQLFTLVAHLTWVRSGIQLTTKKEMIGTRQGPAYAGGYIARKSSRPLQPFHQVADYSAYRFQIFRIHVSPTGHSKRGQLATVAVLPAPSPFFCQNKKRGLNDLALPHTSLWLWLLHRLHGWPLFHSTLH